MSEKNVERIERGTIRYTYDKCHSERGQCTMQTVVLGLHNCKWYGEMLTCSYNNDDQSLTFYRCVQCVEENP